MRLRNKKTNTVTGLLAAIVLTASHTEAAAQRTGAFTDIQSQELVFGGHPGSDDGAGPVRDISFELFVPPSYDPENPPGVLVFISPVIRGKAPDRLHETLRKQNLIWISVNASGDQTEDFERMLEAYGSLAYVFENYKIDGARRYLGGFESGARIASLFAQDYPQFFNGYLFFSGADDWREGENKNQNFINRRRFAFVTGAHDQTRARTRAAFESFEGAGLENIEYFEIEGLGHRLPDAADFGEIIDFLDLRRSGR